MRFLIAVAVLILPGCQSVSNATQFAFAPKHYDAPVLIKADKTKSDQLIIGDEKNYFLNSENPKMQSFIQGGSFNSDSDFAEFAYTFLRVADHRCERREADMLKGSAASKTGFNLVTTATAVAGSAFSSANAANAASGAAAFFNSVNANAGAFQTAINGQYSANLLQALKLARTEQYDLIADKLATLSLGPPAAANAPNKAAHAEISRMLSSYNQSCTIGRAQNKVNETLSGDP